ncbi:MAG TPA: S8 family serine peptidase [Bacteroidota bacterium]|nr:S8 family serine peptidase [Bacteroidota bacterium]
MKKQLFHFVLLASASIVPVYQDAAVAIPQSFDQSTQAPAGSEKIYSIITHTLDVLRSEGVTPANARLMDVPRRFNTRMTRFDESGRIGLNLDVTSVSAGLLERLAGMGGAVVHAIPEAGLVAVYLPIDRVTDAAALEDVRIVRPIMVGVANTGSVTSEGDTLHHALDVRDDLNVNGDSIAVGVISDGCFTWAGSQALGDLPAGFGPPNFTFINGIKSGPSGDEGTAMMEIVHDLSPNSDLYFYGALSLGGSATMIDAIQRLVREKSCDVLVDDLTYFDQPMFEDATPATAGTIAAAAKWANDTGVVYVSSAGNWARGGVTNRSHYQSIYADHDPIGIVSGKPLPAPIPPPAGGVYPPPFSNLHDFDPGPGLDIGLMVIMPGFSGGGEPPELDVILEWNDPWSLSVNDFDLYLYDATFSAIVASSVTAQAGAQNPYETVFKINSGSAPDTFNLVINLFVPPAVPPKLMGLYVYGCSWVEYNTPENSIWGQPGVPEVIAVGAIPYNNITLFETFSSRGNYDVYYPLYQSRPKPDVAAIDGNLITGTGGFGQWDGANWRFYGTSASAPHVAGMAALLLSNSPAMTPAQVHSKFERTAVDLGDPAFDPIFGYGRADIEIAMLEVDTAAVSSVGPYTDTSIVDVPSFFSTADGYAVNTVMVTGGTGPPTDVQSTYSVTGGNPYDDAGVQDPGCPTVRRWYALSQTGGTSGQFDAVVTAYVDETERQAAGIADTNLRLLHWNGSWFDPVQQLSSPERVGNTWIVSGDMQDASFSPFFVGHLVRGFSVTGISGEDGLPDSTVSVKFGIFNSGNGRDTLRCTLSDTRGWSVSPADSAFSIPAASAETLEIFVTIAGSDTVGTVDTVTMVVRSVSDTTLIDSAFVTVTVSEGMVALSVEMIEGWNMVSAPVEKEDMSTTALYPIAVSKAFKYEGGYVSDDTLELGRGYWVKIPAADTLEFTGFARDEDSVDVAAGWNMIGTITSPVAVGDIVQIPDSIVLSVYYGFNGTYFTADSLGPGQAYWVKVSSAGKLVLAK